MKQMRMCNTKWFMPVLFGSVFLVTSGLLFGYTSSEPGTIGDPIVTKSYVDEEIKKYMSQQETKMQTLTQNISEVVLENNNLKIELAKEKEQVKKDFDAFQSNLSELKSSLEALNKENDNREIIDTIKIQEEKLLEVQNQLKTLLEQQAEKALEGDKGNPADETEERDSTSRFEVIELKKGNRLIGDNSTEIILRSGTGKAIASTAGGLADVTSDTKGDLKAEENVPLNHLLITPRDDGRGIHITSQNAWVMVRGTYEVK